MFVAARRNRSDAASREWPTPRSCVSARRARVRIGAVRLARSGLRLVPENLAMIVRLLSRRLGDAVVGLGQVPVREPSGPSNADSNGWPCGRFCHKKYARSVAADRRDGVGLRTKSEEEVRRGSNPHLCLRQRSTNLSYAHV